ncbi:MAG: sugar transferase [Oscillospiraceae bacterium]|nr:sugar transferase [Oscillospiraceae bacterium]
MKLLHFGVTLVIFYTFWLLFRYGAVAGMDKYGFRYNYYVTAGYGLLIFFFNRTYNSYLLGYTRIRTLVFSQALSQFFSAGIIWLGVCIAWKHMHAPWLFFCAIALQVLFDAGWSYMANYSYFKLHPAKRTILIYRNELDKKRFGTVTGKPIERLYKVVKELQYDGYSFKEIRSKLEGYEAIFVAGVHSRCRNGIAKYCKEERVAGFFLPHVGDVIMQEAQHIQSFDAPVLYVTTSRAKPEYRIAKRAFDLIASLLGIVILSPILLVTALAIHFYDGGPAIYKQNRLTRDGKEFQIWKFRSMRVDAEKDGIARLSTGENDSRITPIGRIVRRFRLDELPQLFNILVGDMSFVGPRPERPEIAEQYYKFIPDFKLRLQVKAGLTGYAQIYGKYNTDPYEKLEFDLLYINDMGFLTDLKLIFATFGILFLPESTEGVAAGQTTAMDYESEANRTEKWEKRDEHWAE